MNCKLCASGNTDVVATICARPENETDFGIPTESYKRSVHFCDVCQVFFSIHEFDFKEIYAGKYNSSTYDDRLPDQFKKIMSFPFERSDNRHRARRVHEFMLERKFVPDQSTILDIGSGLCVFLAAMAEYGYVGSCVDPDEGSISLAKKYAGVKEAFLGSIEDISSMNRYDLVTLNKVLEHVPDPVVMLQQAVDRLVPGGICYVELPDGENALRNGTVIYREEFYIEHYFVFTLKSMKYLLSRVNLKINEINAIVEPSGKYTVYAFAEKV